MEISGHLMHPVVMIWTMMIGFLSRYTSCHLVRDVFIMTNIASCSIVEASLQPYGTQLHVTFSKRAFLHTCYDVSTEISCHFSMIPLTWQKLISYGRLVDHGCLLGRPNGCHAVLKNKSVIFYVTMKNHVMVVDKSMNARYNCDFGDVMMSAVATVDSGQALQKHTLMYFHRRFGHLNFDTNKRLASTPH